MENENGIHPLSITVKASGTLSEIVTKAGVSFPFDFENEIDNSDRRIHQTKALWDAGATNSVITKSTAKFLKLKPHSFTQVYHAGGTEIVSVYFVHIALPNNISFPYLDVTECEDTAGDFGLIIGMDIICRGDFAITNVGGKTVFSYQYPSVKMIDFETSNE